jgi:hypothetical protein
MPTSDRSGNLLSPSSRQEKAFRYLWAAFDVSKSWDVYFWQTNLARIEFDMSESRRPSLKQGNQNVSTFYSCPKIVDIMKPISGPFHEEKWVSDLFRESWGSRNCTIDGKSLTGNIEKARMYNHRPVDWVIRMKWATNPSTPQFAAERMKIYKAWEIAIMD